jgi:hypothetical protein
MTNSFRNWRQEVREELEILATEMEQVEYEKRVPHVDITQELLCGWFNDSYHPDDDEFKSHFTPVELAAMAAFNAFFDERIALLPESYGTVQNWLKCHVWREVMFEAQKTLTLIPA